MFKHFCLITLAAVTFGAQPTELCSGAGAQIAIQALRNRVNMERPYVSWTKDMCLAYRLEKCHNNMAEIAIFEVHSQACGGDPATSPVVDRFRVYTKTKKVEWYDITEDQFIEFSKVRSNDRR
jgi:hypothetical protein